MGFLDRFKGKPLANPATEGLPDMTGEAPASTHEASKRTKQEQKEFRARENASTAAAENKDLPSVNRRTAVSQAMTVAGYVLVAGVATGLVYMANSEKPIKRNVKPEAQIVNRLPALPEPPPPPSIQPDKAPALPTELPPIALQNRAPANAKSGKPVMDWTERKMGGALLVSEQADSEARNRNQSVMLAQDTSQGTASGFGSGGGSPGGNNEMAARLEPTITKGVSAGMLPDRNFLITKGTTLDCALETALDSSVPGVTTCRLTRDVYSDNGQVMLLDRGSQLVGEYQGGVKQGQVRLFVLWSRAKTPNGVTVSLNSPGTDALGRSGLEGWVDNHFLERFGAAILMSFVGDSVAALASNNSGTTTTNVFGGAANGGEKIVEKILDSTVTIPPTMVKNQGDHIQVMVARDLDFSTVYGLRLKK